VVRRSSNHSVSFKGSSKDQLRNIPLIPLSPDELHQRKSWMIDAATVWAADYPDRGDTINRNSEFLLPG